MALQRERLTLNDIGQAGASVQLLSYDEVVHARDLEEAIAKHVRLKVGEVEQQRQRVVNAALKRGQRSGSESALSYQI